jgi:hypothetical protein
MKKFLIIVAALLSVLAAKSQSTDLDTTFRSRPAKVHLPAGYYNPANSSTTYPCVVFLPGLGETGFGVSRLDDFGPHKYLANGWNGTTTLGNGVHEWIVISIDPGTGWYNNETTMNTWYGDILSRYRVRGNKIHLTGYSSGGYTQSMFITEGTTFNNKVWTFVGVLSASINGDQQGTYPNYYDNFSTKGRVLWFEQINDFRDGATVVNRMNTTTPGSAIFAQTNLGNGGHTCCVDNYYGGTVAPSNFTLDGKSQTMYQWMLRNGGDTTLSGGNQYPTANAGTDQTISLPTNQVTLSGSGNDPDGTISSYAWTKITGPSSFSITNASSASTTVTGLVQGVYEFRLTVTDNNGATGTDVVQITVNAVPGGGLNAHAGPDQVFRFPRKHTTLDASASTDDGSVTAWSWAKISGPSTYKIVNADNEKTLVTDLVAGTYQFEVTVTDNSANTDKDTVQIIVNPVKTDAGGDTYNWTYTYQRDYSGLVGPGDTIKIPAGNYSMHIVTGIVGSEDYPVVIINQGGQAVFEAWNFDSTSNRHIKFTGTGHAGTPYGFKMRNVSQGFFAMHLKCQGPIEVDHVEMTGTVMGLQWRDNDATIDKPYLGGSFHNLWIHNIDGGTTSADGNEGMYLGNSSTSSAPKIAWLHVYDVLIDRTDRDGLQISNAQNVLVERVKILNPSQIDPGFTNPAHDGQRHAFNMGHDVQGVARDMYITQPPEYAVFFSGGNLTMECVTIKDTANQGMLSIFGKNFEYNDATWNETYQQLIWRNIQIIDGAGVDVTSLTVEGPIRASKVEHIKITGGASTPMRWNPTSGGVAANVTDVGAGATFSNGCVPPTQTTIWTSDWPATSPGTTNQFPVANAGADQSITLPTSSVTVNGNGSTDADGTISSYAWTKISGPATFTITNASNVSTSITGLVQGVYVFRLTVTDNSGATHSDDVQITVNPAPVTPNIKQEVQIKKINQ